MRKSLFLPLLPLCFWVTSCSWLAFSQSSSDSSPKFSSYNGEDVYLVMNKDTNELSVRSLVSGEIVYKSYRAISGTNPGDKLFEGDKKTPEGIYFIEGKIPHSRLQKLHGAAAFATNYPNPVDKIHKRTGSGIWVHGVENENRMQKRFDTLGCVALGNSDVVDLGQYLKMRETPIVIVDKQIPDQPIGLLPNDGPLAKRIYAWVEAWSSRDADRYLSFYSPDFQGRGMSISAWVNHKKRLVRLYKDINVRIRNLRILRHGKYSVAIFEQNYKSNLYQSIGKKRLYLMGEGENAQIISEESLLARQGPAGKIKDDWEEPVAPLDSEKEKTPTLSNGALNLESTSAVEASREKTSNRL